MPFMDVFMGAKPLLLLVFLVTFAINHCFTQKSDVLCIESEREALLKFKQDVSDPWNMLASWTKEGDCCEFAGVVCNNITSHVQELDLVGLGGKINPSLFNLKHLTYLELFLNKFTGMIPSQIGNLSHLHYLSFPNYYHTSLYVENTQWLSSLSQLRYLDLSDVNLSRASHDWFSATSMLPSLQELHLSSCELHHLPSDLPIVNFTNLISLDLSYNNFSSLIPNWMCSLDSLESLELGGSSFFGSIPSCLHNITGLRYLALSYNSFSSSIPDSIYGFSRLQHLNLGYCDFQGSISNAIGDLTSLITLDLSYNTKLEGKLPNSFGNLCNLRKIDMSGVSFGDDLLWILDILPRCILDRLEELRLRKSRLFSHFPDVVEKLGQSNNLDHLDLGSNSLTGPIPASIVRLSSITTLFLFKNKLNGTLPDCIGQLSSLQFFDISQNSLHGVVSEAHFAGLAILEEFSASGNNLTFRVASNWIPHFQILVLRLSSCQLGPKFPNWIHTQKNLYYLDMSLAGISDTIPSWFWNFSSQLMYLNLSHNQMQGEISYITPIHDYFVIDLGSNQLKGQLPPISANVTELYLSHNSFSGSLSFFLCSKTDEVKRLQILDLERNQLSGEIPDCWMSWPMLEFIHIGSNNLTGHIPSSMRYLSVLLSLHLQNNSLFGEFPPSFQNCTELLVIDIGENQFTGEIPDWIGGRLSKLKILILESNKFHGQIPTQLCGLNSLQVMVFSHNNLFGNIPTCFNNMSAMIRKRNVFYTGITYNFFGFYNIYDNVILGIKGRDAEYSTILLLVTLLDLSDNNLSGGIPREMTDLVGLQSLNLSRNRLAGRIPWEIGSMSSLESLDFSSNHLVGEIPQTMATLTFLSHLNLSCNNLTGKIPSSTQLQSFDESSFVGNKLCGPPLTPNCGVSGVIPNDGNGEGKGGDSLPVEFYFYVSMGLGFVVAFWGVVGPILFNKSWRFSYYQFLDTIWIKFRRGYTCK